MFSQENIQEMLNNTKDNKAMEYIILQNNDLLKEIMNVKEELKNTIHEKNEFEEEIENVTKSKNMLQSYLKNVNEINKLQKSLKLLYEQHIVEINYIIYTSMIMLMLVQMIMYTFEFVNIYTKLICMYTIFGLAIYKYYEKQQHLLITCKDIFAKLKTAEKAVDMVVDFIDNL